MLLPRWTEYQESSGGRDPLGLDRVAGRFLDRALPAITSQTQRARYYSLYCWIIQGVRESVPRGQGRPFVAAFQRRDTTYALACVAHHAGEDEERTAVVGYRRASKRWRDAGSECAIDFAVLKEQLGGFDAAYRAPMRRLGLIADGTDGLQLSPTGTAVANAFGKTVARTAIVERDVFTERNAPRRAIESFAKVACLCQLSDPDERELLRAAFFQRGPGWEAQHDTLVWLLHVVSAAEHADVMNAEERELPELALEWAAYGDCLADGTPYAPPRSLAPVVEAWRVFAALGFFAYFVEEFARAVADLLRISGNAMSVADLAAALGEAFDDETISARVESLSAFGAEHELYDEVREAAGPGKRAASALDGLLAGYALHRNAKGGSWSTFAEYAGQDLWPGSMRAVVERMGPLASLRDLASVLIDKFVLRHHQQVLYEKRRAESAVFVREDDRWRADQLIKPRFLPSRLGSCTTILVDLGLLERSGDHGVTLTAEGRALLRSKASS